MNFIISIINYGGRITDDKDARLIETLIKEYINPNIDKENFMLSSNSAYQIPKDLRLESILNMINQMPTYEEAEIFGLNQNANIIFN